jgi:hypothetical protein
MADDMEVLENESCPFDRMHEHLCVEAINLLNYIIGECNYSDKSLLFTINKIMNEDNLDHLRVYKGIKAARKLATGKDK